MPIRFETEWMPGEGVRGPELTSTWASLLIRIDDSVVTRVVDRRAQTVRDHVYVPLYPLAESLVTNWWFLLHEVGNPTRSADHAFMRRHALVSARDGYAFPDLHVVSTGNQTLVASRPASFPGAKLDFQCGDQVRIERHEFIESCSDLVDRVVRRLVSCGVEGTLLQEEWAAVQAVDPDESLFCRTAAGLGWDPYALSDAQQEAVLRLEDGLDAAILEDAIAILDAERLQAQVASIAAALEPANGTTLPLEHVRGTCAQPNEWTDGSPWHAGYALARDVRRRLHLDLEPLPTTKALADAFRENPASLDEATQSRDLGVTDLVNGVVATDQDGLPSFAVRNAPECNRRFHFCRGLAEVLTSPGSPVLLTRTRSDRQQRSRAFAAEFLAPAAALRARVRQPILDDEDVDELAATFGVSSWLIKHQLQNHEIAGIW